MRVRRSCSAFAFGSCENAPTWTTYFPPGVGTGFELEIELEVELEGDGVVDVDLMPAVDVPGCVARSRAAEGSCPGAAATSRFDDGWVAGFDDGCGDDGVGVGARVAAIEVGAGGWARGTV